MKRLPLYPIIFIALQATYEFEPVKLRLNFEAFTFTIVLNLLWCVSDSQFCVSAGNVLLHDHIKNIHIHIITE